MQSLTAGGSHLQNLLATLMRRGRPSGAHTGKVSSGTFAITPIAPAGKLSLLCRQLLSGRGEASGVARASEILRLYGGLSRPDRAAFFHHLAEDFGPDWTVARAAWARHEEDPTRETFRALTRVLEPPRQELFRRLNRAPGGTAALVELRADLLAQKDPDLLAVDDDLAHLLQSWFNRGFLVMQRIDWSTPANLLERIIRYEAVHRIGDWDELRRRLLPEDRRCYGFFHPSMADDPLIFVEVALTGAIPQSVQVLLAQDRIPTAAKDATTAVFYSISNCQAGLLGISFGNFLIKEVVEDLSRELLSLSTFVTLSPVPGFRRWLDDGGHIRNLDPVARAALDTPDWPTRAGMAALLEDQLAPLAVDYLLSARDPRGRPVDPVSRFHLGNGARLERLCWNGDTSPKGLAESAGLMVNYLYDLASVEANHEAFANDGEVVASQAVRRAARTTHSRKGAVRRHVA